MITCGRYIIIIMQHRGYGALKIHLRFYQHALVLLFQQRKIVHREECYPQHHQHVHVLVSTIMRHDGRRTLRAASTPAAPAAAERPCLLPHSLPSVYVPYCNGI